jgi:undecaprenyl-diphosphatase
MRDYLVSGFLGMVEGFTEFIPISSTAHRRLAEAALRLSLSGKFWKLQLVIVQLGATFGLIALFALKLRMATRPVRQNVNELPRLLHTAPAISVGWAFLSTIVSAFALKQMIDRNFDSLTVIGSSLLIGGIVMWSSDRLAVRSSLRVGENVTTLQAVWIGACQTLAAVFPGTSHSMATIIAGEIGGLSRPAAVEFSFLLFVPTMLAATFFELRQFQPSADSLPLDGHGFAALAIGFATAAMASYLSANWLLIWVQRRGLAIFGLYRICLGATVLIWLLIRN